MSQYCIGLDYDTVLATTDVQEAFDLLLSKPFAKLQELQKQQVIWRALCGGVRSMHGLEFCVPLLVLCRQADPRLTAVSMLGV